MREEKEKLQAAKIALEREFNTYRQGAERGQSLQAGRIQQEASLQDAREANAKLTGGLVEAKAVQGQVLADWQARFDHDHRWHLLRIEKEKERARQAAVEALTQRETALHAQVARQYNADADKRLARVTQQAHKLQGQQRLLQADRERFEQANSALGRTVTNLQAQLQARSAECDRLQRLLTQTRSSATPRPEIAKRTEDCSAEAVRAARCCQGQRHCLGPLTAHKSCRKYAVWRSTIYGANSPKSAFSMKLGVFVLIPACIRSRSDP